MMSPRSRDGKGTPKADAVHSLTEIEGGNSVDVLDASSEDMSMEPEEGTEGGTEKYALSKEEATYFQDGIRI